MPPLPLIFKDKITDSPLQELHSPFLEKAKVQLCVKRDDLIHPQFGGNKWRKLKYNLIYAKENNFETLLTFGGAWSNHIYATAAAGKYFGFNTIGLIRGEQHSPLNPCLAFAEDCGMALHYLSRIQYKEKNTAAFLKKIKQQFGNTYILPEGGSNSLALDGCKEIVGEICSELNRPFDIICCASGTGATLAGLALGLEAEHTKSTQSGSKQAYSTPLDSVQSAIGFSVLKGDNALTSEVNNFLAEKNTTIPSNTWRIENQYHFGGYAKINDELIHFMKTFQSQYNIALDAVYTAKMFYGLFDLIKSSTFQAGTVIVAIHSGGLQGNRGFKL